jgi:hypothetical protein
LNHTTTPSFGLYWLRDIYGFVFFVFLAFSSFLLISYFLVFIILSDASVGINIMWLSYVMRSEIGV